MTGNGDDVWFVDMGCTEYIIHKPNLLENKKVISNEVPIVIPNGDAIPGLQMRSLIGHVKCQWGVASHGHVQEGKTSHDDHIGYMT
uniref:Uncharacterized protein n=1 Tax=Lactuca sativa TaxID=4236 RepID=A0A9R1UYG7_LACSA|nr:hypothetical protein LSAT_V11C700352400 [Lactuca sativa]